MNEQTMIDFVNKIADNDKVAPFQNGFVVLSNQEMVEFAELIVRECADIAKHHVMNISTYADAEFVEEQIGKHFGVEE
jgi:hypothetical protein